MTQGGGADAPGTAAVEVAVEGMAGMELVKALARLWMAVRVVPVVL